MTKRDMNALRSKKDLFGFSKRRLYGKSLVSSFRFVHEIDRFQVVKFAILVHQKIFSEGHVSVSKKSCKD